MEINALTRKIKQKLRLVIIDGFRVLPIKKKKIIFDNFLGKGYGDNPKYISEELLKRNLDLDLVWVVKDKNEKFPKGIRTVEYGSICAMYEFATAKVWIDNVRNTHRPKKRKNQFYIQTWHASLGIKNVEQDVEERLSTSYVQAAKYDGEITDLMFANNEYMLQDYKRAFWYDGPIMKCGLPRNSILFDTPQEIYDKVAGELGISRGYRTILYAPTFREGKGVQAFIRDYKRICSAFKERFDEKMVVILRLHPNVAEKSKEIIFDELVKNASFYSDMQELLAFCDFLITDFSSCAFDFSFTRKPVFLYVSDYDEYIAKERDLRISMESLPYSLSKSEDELVDAIMKFDYNEYQKKCTEFFKDIGLVEDGHGAKTIVECIKKQLKMGTYTNRERRGQL